MSYIEWVTLIVQSICMSAIIATAFKNKKVALVWCSVLISGANYYFDGQLWWLLGVILLVDSLYEKKLRLPLAMQMVLALLLQTFCELVSLLIVSIIEDLPIMVLHLNEMTYFESSILFLSCFIFISTMIFYFNIAFKHSSYAFMMGLLLTIILYIIDGFLNALRYGNITLDDIQKFSVAFIIFGLVLLRTIFLFNKETEQNIAAQRIETQNTMVRNNLLLIDGIQSNIQDLEHRMNYVLLSLKHMILDNKKEEALKIIQENTWNLKKVSYYINTNNPYFDNLFSRILKRLRSKGIVPSCFLEIPKGKLDEDIYFISLLVDVLTQVCELVSDENELSINIQVKSELVLFKLLITNTQMDTITKINYPELPFSIHEIDEGIVEIKLIYQTSKEL